MGYEAKCNGPAVQRETQVQAAFTQLCKAIAELQERVEDTENSLVRVLRSEPSSPTELKPPADTPFNVPLATDIQSATDKVLGCCRRLDILHGLIEV